MQALRFCEAWKEWPCFSMPPRSISTFHAKVWAFLRLHIKGERFLLICLCGWMSAT